MPTPGPRILRIGIVHDNRILEERLFRRPASVTIGQGPENTFVYPLPGFPRSHELLSYSRGTYTFVFPRGLIGKVSSADDLFDLDELVQTGRATPAGPFYQLPLGDDSRGKIRLGELSLLFQFVTAPPPVPRLRLPAGAELGWIRQIDLPYAAFLTLSFLLLAVPAATLHAWYETRGQYLVTRGKQSRVFTELEAEIDLRRQRAPKVKVAEPTRDAPDRGESASAEKAPEKEPAAAAPTREVQPKARTKAVATAADGTVDPYKKRVERVRERTLLKFVMPGAGGGEGGPIVEGVHAERMAEAWSFAGGADTAQAGDVAQFVAPPRSPGYVNGPGRRGGPRPIAVRDVEGPGKTPEVAIRLKIHGELGDRFGQGEVDKGSVADVFKRRQGALRHCYEKRLAVNPALSGRVRVTFTIGAGGRVTAVAITDNSSGDAELGRCLADRIREWPFPRPRGGSVTFVHTLVLTSG